MKIFRPKVFAMGALIALMTAYSAGPGWAHSRSWGFRMVQTQYQKAPMERLTPMEREQARKNYLRFKNLPPQERERIRKNFREWQRLSPEEKQRLRERYQRMHPQERQGPEESPER
ncbi:MAG TPA: DUF3106 domain-containing protein [Nitrospiria bacterium]|nr:DUF3106 domain-containing protein [Nitrospiria bacterium]